MIQVSPPHGAGHKRFSDRSARWLLTAFCALLFASPLAATSAAADEIDSIVVRFRDDVVRGGAEMSSMQRDALAATLGTPFNVVGRTREGAFTLQFAAPLDVDTARAAINRVRLDAGVLYANAAAGPALPDTTGRPTNRIIVKYRDASLVALSRAGIALDSGQITRLATLAGQSLSWLRGAHDGANVLQMLQRLPISQVEAIAARIAQEPDVDYAQPDYIRTVQLVPTDPCYASASTGACGGGYQWDLFDPVAGINMPNAWNITTGSASINVAIIDTGALLNHPDLTGRFVGGYDMIADCAVANDGQPGPCTFSPLPYSKANPPLPAFNSVDSDGSDPGDWISSAENAPCSVAGGGPVPCTSPIAAAPPPPPYYDWFEGCPTSNSSWHGTHVAGTIGATPNNGIGIAGINWVSKIVPVRVLGKCGGYSSDIANAMVWAAGGSVPSVPNNANPARVESLSLGGGGPCDAITQGAIDLANSLGTVVVVAAGNSNANANSSNPGNCNGVVTVAATTRTGLRARYSNYGSMVEIAAPGGNADGVTPDILSTINGGITIPNANWIYAQYAGTSMATPHVSGVVSLMLSVNPSLTPAQVLSKIETTARAFPTPGPACNLSPQAAACNCTTALCGSGIIDAAAAVASAAAGSSSTSLASSANPASVGTTVTFTATVTGTNPTGTVDFKDNGVSIAGCNAQPLSGSGNSNSAQCATGALAVGTHPIVAAYGGDGSNPPSGSATLSQVITNGPGTTLTSSQNPANAGAQITLTATVTANNPTGRVNFKDGAASIGGCGAVLLAGTGNTKTAQCNTSSLTAGTHNLTAVYGGDKQNVSQTSAVLSQVINGGAQTSSSTVVASSQNPSTYGATVTFTATVTGTNPTGTVDFHAGASTIAGCSAQAVSGGGNSRTAQCATAALAAGSHNITANYGGDPGNTPSASAPLVQNVNPASGTTTLASSANPANAGVTVTFTATVNSVAPTGTVTFKDNGVSIAGCNAQPLSGSGNSKTAQCATSALAAGTHPIVATYSGDGSNASTSSAPLSQVINAGGGGLTTSTTALASSFNPSFFKLPVTYTATVTGTNPTGAVNFKDNGTTIGGCGAVALAGAGNTRTAQCTTGSLLPGTHPLTATYSGDAGNTASTSPILTQTVN